MVDGPFEPIDVVLDAILEGSGRNEVVKYA